MLDTFIDFKDMNRLIAIVASSIASATEDDYLLISGIALVNVIAMAAWLTRFKTCQILSWDGDSHYSRYLLKTDDLSAMMGAMK